MSERERERRQRRWGEGQTGGRRGGERAQFEEYSDVRFTVGSKSATEREWSGSTLPSCFPSACAEIVALVFDTAGSYTKPDVRK